MKKIFYPVLLTAILLLPACSFHFPYDWDSEYSYGDYSIVLKVNPDDAQVLLNGKFIGEAYEFSTRASALKIRSANNELVIKKDGYIEEEIDLDKYNMRRITITLELKPDMVLTRKTVVKGEVAPPPPPPKGKEEGKIVKEMEIPKGEVKSSVTGIFAPVILEISPEESSIYVDGKFWGIAPEGGVINNFNLQKGNHRIEVLKPGYKTVQKNINVAGEKELKVIIKLEKK